LMLLCCHGLLSLVLLQFSFWSLTNGLEGVELKSHTCTLPDGVEIKMYIYRKMWNEVLCKRSSCWIETHTQYTIHNTQYTISLLTLTFICS
jgi:hypothetical protein